MLAACHQRLTADGAAEMKKSGQSTVRVAVRVRPLTEPERNVDSWVRARAMRSSPRVLMLRAAGCGVPAQVTVDVINKSLVVLNDPKDRTHVDVDVLHRSKETRYAFDVACDQVPGRCALPLFTAPSPSVFLPCPRPVRTPACNACCALCLLPRRQTSTQREVYELAAQVRASMPVPTQGLG